MRASIVRILLIIAVLAGPCMVSVAFGEPAGPDASDPLASASSASANSARQTQPAQATTIVPPTEEDIRQAIADLNHPSPARRREGVGKLADWGPLAFEALGRVASGPDLEPALLARDLLREMGEVLFVGSRVRLAADRTRIRWDEPVTLTVEVVNPTPGAVLVPWPMSSASKPSAADASDANLAATQPAGRQAAGATQTSAASHAAAVVDDVRQVAAMMDIADHLAVIGPDGEPLQVRVDSIEQSTAVHRAVEVRAGENPPAHMVPAGSTEQLRVHAFNRGWARYPMLAAGKYQVRFLYQPQWKDPNWVAQGYGLIESNPVTIEVTEAAPREIREARRPVKLRLQRQDGKVVGELRNTWDRDLWINLNLNAAPDTHARLEWWVQTTDDFEMFMLDGDAGDPQFAADRVKIVSPGEAVTVAEANASALAGRARDVAGDNATLPLQIGLKYTHLPTAQMLRDSLREKGRRESVPSAIFSGSAAADPVTIP